MWNGRLSLLTFLGCYSAIPRVRAGIYMNALFQEYEFPSVNYFDLLETRWPHYDQILNGRVAVLPSLNLEEIFSPLNETTNGTATSNKTAEHTAEFFDNFRDNYDLDVWKESPKFLIVRFGPSSEFEADMANASIAAQKFGADFVVLVVGPNPDWQERFSFWWSHRFPGCPTKQILPQSDGNKTHFFMAVDAQQGQEIIEIRKFFGNNTAGEFYFGIDNIDSLKGRDFAARLVFYMVMVFCVSKWMGTEAGRNSRSSGQGNRRTYFRFTGEDLGMGEIQSGSAEQDCPVCLETMHPGESVRILPCRHVLHHDCITGWFTHGDGKYTCPLCKMDLCDHLKEQRVASLSIKRVVSGRRRWRLWPFGRRIQNVEAEDQLIAVPVENSAALSSTQDDVGDLELMEEPRNIA